MEIKILGAGCANCERLYENALAAVGELGIEADIIKVEQLKDIMKFGVMGTPAIAVNGKVKAVGRVSTVEEIKKYIQGEK